MRPAVDIIIPFHGQYELVTECLAAIYACTPNQNYKVILVDDCSPNETYLRNITHGKKTVGIRLEKQSGFGAALAAGFAAGTNDHVAFLHSDTKVDNINWLANLQRGLAKYRAAGVKLVSARTDDPGTAAGYDPRLIGEPSDNVGDAVVAQALPLFCAYCHRKLFQKIGGFIKPYPFAWYEDEELFWRMKYYGYKQAVIGNSWVRHRGGATVKDMLTRPKIKEVIENNRNLCLRDVRLYVK